ncbi:dihydrodipicolinate synthase family protein [Chromatiales bacterium (ex Bugula neritina AB1)]|nr:dihydrodipicolinate synthase family protein [Chromatiales bacterium (ex Bugula neritina AB1)]
MSDKKIENFPEGIWGAVLLPINKSNSIDWTALEDELAILCQGPLDGIYSNGTAGEFHNQTAEEYIKLTELVASTATALNKPFQLGISHSNPRVTRQRLLHAIAFKPDGIQFTLPDWWVLSATERLDYMADLHRIAADTALVLYNPPHAKQRLTLKEIAELRTVAPSLIGAKLPGGDETWYQEHHSRLPDFSVFVPGHRVAFGRPLGASGSYSNVACLSPAGAVRHWQQINTDLPAAVALEYRINRFMRDSVLALAARKNLSNTALDKLLAAIGNWGPVTEQCLWPYRSADTDDVKQLSRIARKLLPEMFEH